VQRFVEMAAAGQAGQGIQVGQGLEGPVGPLEVLGPARHLPLQPEELELVLDPRHHLRGLEGPGHVIGAPRFEGPELVRPVLEGAHEDDRDLAGRALGAEAPAHLEAVDAGQADVQEDQLGRGLLDDLQGGGPVCGQADRVATLAQDRAEHSHVHPAVVHDQDVPQEGLPSPGEHSMAERAGMMGGPMDEVPSPRRRIKELEVMVAEAVYETPDTTTLVLFTGNDHLDYKPGHFLTIDPHQFEALERFTAFLEDLKGRREPPRAYSMASAPHEKYLAVTIKEERYTSGA